MANRLPKNWQPGAIKSPSGPGGLDDLAAAIKAQSLPRVNDPDGNKPILISRNMLNQMLNDRETRGIYMGYRMRDEDEARLAPVEPRLSRREESRQFSGWLLETCIWLSVGCLVGAWLAEWR